jgi:hypothetical protein
MQYPVLQNTEELGSAFYYSKSGGIHLDCTDYLESKRTESRKNAYPFLMLYVFRATILHMKN